MLFPVKGKGLSVYSRGLFVYNMCIIRVSLLKENNNFLWIKVIIILNNLNNDSKYIFLILNFYRQAILLNK